MEKLSATVLKRHMASYARRARWICHMARGCTAARKCLRYQFFTIRCVIRTDYLMVLALKPVHLAMPLCLVRKRHVAGAWFFGRRVLHIYIYMYCAWILITPTDDYPCSHVRKQPRASFLLSTGVLSQSVGGSRCIELYMYAYRCTAVDTPHVSYAFSFGHASKIQGQCAVQWATMVAARPEWTRTTHHY